MEVNIEMCYTYQTQVMRLKLRMVLMVSIL